MLYYIRNIKKNIFTYLIVLLIQPFLFSCQSTEILEKIVFDNEQLTKITIKAEKKIINEKYEFKFDDPYIDHSLEFSPLDRLNSWLNENINVFGTENELIINILDASLKKTEIKNDSSKKFQQKQIFFYELNYLVEYILYDDANSILSTTIVKTERSTTSGQFISLNELEKIIDSLILNALIDVSLESNRLINIHMSKFTI